MIVDLATYRRTGKIAPPVQLLYDDVRIEFARRVEERLSEMEAAMRGDWRDSPSDTQPDPPRAA